MPLALSGLTQVMTGPIRDGVAALEEAVPALEARHVVRQRGCMHRNFRMRVRAKQLGAFDADRLVAQRRAFRGTGDDPDVLR